MKKFTHPTPEFLQLAIKKVIDEGYSFNTLAPLVHGGSVKLRQWTKLYEEVDELRIYSAKRSERQKFNRAGLRAPDHILSLVQWNDHYWKNKT